MTGRLRAQPLFLLAALPALAAAQVLESADAALAADRFPPMRLARLAFDKFGVDAAATQGTPNLIVDTASSGLLQACTAAPGDCSLRGALARAQDAALAPGDDTIGFAIPAASDPGCVAATGVCTINLTSAVTVATTSVAQGGLRIDGYTQSGASANTQPAPAGSDAQLKIEITGSALTFQAPITLRGIAFGAPLSIQRIGGFCCGTPPGSGRYEIEGNYFGLRADGQTPFATTGTLLTVSAGSGNIDGVRIGGALPAQRNVFGSSGGAGAATECLRLSGTNHLVHGNLIGSDRSGTLARGCVSGILLDGHGMLIGGAAAGEGNAFAGHFERALQINGTQPVDALKALIQGNRFGLAADGSTPLPIGTREVFSNDLPMIRGDNAASSVRIGGSGAGAGNLFAHAGLGRPPSPATPPFVQTAVSGRSGRWEILGNRYRSNRGVGIDSTDSGSGRRPNDAGDADTAARGKLQNFPVISAMRRSGDAIEIDYTVDSAFAALPAAGQSTYPLRIEFYAADGAAGAELLGVDSYPSASAQLLRTASFTLPPGVPLGADAVIVATATDSPPLPGEPALGTTGHSSEFSFHPLESFSFVSLTPASVPAGVPYTARVRLVAAPGTPFKPNGQVLIFDGRGSECTAFVQAVAAERTGEGECTLITTGAPGSVTVTASYSVALNAFALITGAHPTNVSQGLTLTPGITALELVSGDAQSAPLGEAFAQPLVVRMLGAGGAPVAGVPVAFSGPASSAGASFDPATPVSGADGLASTTATAIRAGGSYTVTASVGALTRSFALTNEPGFDTALAIVSHSPNPSNPGQTVTVTTALNPEAGGPAPTGAIAITANSGEACSIVLPATSCQLSFASLGERVIQAFYPGDASYTSSKAAFVSHTVANTPSLRIDDTSRNEGNAGSTAFVFLVTLQNPTGGAVSVDFASANDSAVAPGDYTAANGTLNFSGTTTSQSISVQVAGDTTVEPDERFFVNLANASGASLADAQGIGSILDDDQPPPPAASIDDVIIQEPVQAGLTQTRARFTISLDRPAPAPVSLRVQTQDGSAIAQQDFDGNDFILRFAAGERQKRVDVFIREDSIAEPTETFGVLLSAAQGLTIADASGTGSILDDGPDASLTVNSAADPGDGVCTPADCTLREAILRAAQLQSVRIVFAIPGSGPHRIALQSPLPVLPGALHSIDGYTQPGSRPNSALLAEERALDADHWITVAGGGFTLRHGGTLRGLKLESGGVAVRNAFNGRPTRIVGIDASAGVFIEPDGRSADALLDVLVGGDGADRNRLGQITFGSNNTQLRSGTRIRAEGNVIDGLISITDDNPNGIRSSLDLSGNRAIGVRLDPGSRVFSGPGPGLELDSRGNHPAFRSWTRPRVRLGGRLARREETQGLPLQRRATPPGGLPGVLSGA